MSWLYVFLGFSLLIVLHEAGHFVGAKATGMRVERFFLFFGPKIVSVRRGETEYGIGTIPLGGFAKISGMSPEEELPPEVEPRAYHRQPVWKRIVVVAAGPAVNIALAFVIFFFVSFSFQEVDGTVGSVKAGSPAAGAGLRPGDRLVAVDGQSFSGAAREKRIAKFRDLIAAHKCPDSPPAPGCRAAKPAELGIVRGGRLMTLGVYPTYDREARRTLLGIEYATFPAATGVGEATSFALDKMWFVVSGTARVISHIFETEERKEISSVVGIGDVGHEVVGLGIVPALMLLALVSLSLGLLNLLPFLPLDGGHIFWSLVEKVRGKPVPFRVIAGASVVGVVLVAMLMAIGLSNDIGRLTGEGFHVR
jgi:regulator of sigma E protease